MSETGAAERIERAVAAPYTRLLNREQDGGYSCQVLELPGCISAGASAQQAMDHLDEAIALWVGAELKAARDVPEPLDPEAFSGRVTLRLPPSLHERASTLAALDGVSLNRWLSAAVAYYAGLAAGAADRVSYPPAVDERPGLTMVAEGPAPPCVTSDDAPSRDA